MKARHVDFSTALGPAAHPGNRRPRGVACPLAVMPRLWALVHYAVSSPARPMGHHLAVWFWTPWTIRRRSLGFIVPVLLFAVTASATSSGPVSNRVGRFLPDVAAGAGLYLIPALFVLAFVRLSGPYVGCLLAFCVAVPVALVSIEHSHSSTAGLYILWLPYIGSLAAVVGSLVDAAARRWLLRRPAEPS